MDSIFYLNFFSAVALTPVFITGLFGILFLRIKQKSKATLYFGSTFFLLIFFYSAYTVSAMMYHPAAVYHRYVTIFIVLVGSWLYPMVILNFPQPMYPRFTKWFLRIGICIGIIMTMFFIYKSLSTDIVYHFDGHYYDFAESTYSKLIGILVLLLFFSALGIGIWKAIRMKSKIGYTVVLFAFVLIIGPIVPAFLNVYSRAGLIGRDTYQISQSILTIGGFFLTAVVYINYTKDRTTFITKILGISLATFLIIYQGILYFGLHGLDVSFDKVKYSKSALCVETNNFDYSDVEYVWKYNYKKDSVIIEKNNTDTINILTYKKECYNNYILAKILSADSINFDETVSEILADTRLSFFIYKDLINSVFISKNSCYDIKNDIIEVLEANRKKILYTKRKIENIPEKSFLVSINAYMKKARFKELNPYIKSIIKKAEDSKSLKEQVLNLFVPINKPTSRLYRRNIHDRVHYTGYTYYNKEKDELYEIGYSYRDYRIHVNHTATMFTYALLIMMIVVLVGFPLFFRWSLLLPIKNILSGLDKIRRGNYLIKIPVRVKDEIGVISENFNDMSEKIYQATVNLEKIVEERTQEINQQKEEIQAQADLMEITNKELEKLSIIAEETENAIIISDAMGNIQWVNKAYTRLHGYTFEDIIDMFDQNLNNIYDSNEFEKQLHKCFKYRMPVVFATQCYTKDDMEIWVQISLTPILDNKDVNKIIAVETDITKIKQVEEELTMQNEEIEAQRDKIENQKDKLERKQLIMEYAVEKLELKNKQITDSIVYAKRIQNGILPNQEYIDMYFPESFIYFNPKDIVSGDFYWVKKIQNYLYVAAVDCTGHGVPGAFMSLIGYNLLEAITSKQNSCLKPSEILDKLKYNIIERLKDDNSSIYKVNDGMDVALVRIDTESNIVQFAGAYNPLYIVRNNRIIEIKANRFPVGRYLKEIEQKFDNHEVVIESGDICYIFSDGYKDQLGGKNNEKLFSGRFKELLISISQEPIKKQKDILHKKMIEWKGDIDQCDDMVIIGFKPYYKS